jgi:hypothetical protein
VCLCILVTVIGSLYRVLRVEPCVRSDLQFSRDSPALVRDIVLQYGDRTSLAAVEALDDGRMLVVIPSA